jgi:hypothetical protein
VINGHDGAQCTGQLQDRAAELRQLPVVKWHVRRG